MVVLSFLYVQLGLPPPSPSWDQTHPLHQMTRPPHQRVGVWLPVYTLNYYSEVVLIMKFWIITFSRNFALSSLAWLFILVYFSVLSFSIRFASAAFNLSFTNHHLEDFRKRKKKILLVLSFLLYFRLSLLLLHFQAFSAWTETFKTDVFFLLLSILPAWTSLASSSWKALIGILSYKNCKQALSSALEVAKESKDIILIDKNFLHPSLHLLI